jgi:hypothetical protein
MLFSDTKENRALADATISRLKAEARRESTRASLFKLGGYSAFVLCLGLGCGAAFLGYASVKKAQSSSYMIAEILAKAISNARVTTKGEVRLLPGAIVSMKPDTTVDLAPTASVNLEPGGTVQVENTRPRFNTLTSMAKPKLGDNVMTSSRITDIPRSSLQLP